MLLNAGLETGSPHFFSVGLSCSTFLSRRTRQKEHARHGDAAALLEERILGMRSAYSHGYDFSR